MSISSNCHNVFHFTLLRCISLCDIILPYGIVKGVIFTNKRKYIGLSISALTLLWIVFIFSNSLQTGSVSGNASSSVTAMINEFFGSFISGFSISSLLIRKLAHFGEFALLSLLFCFDIYLLFGINRADALKRKALTLLSVPLSMIIASCDETIQLFVEGRVGCFTDVLIDTSGALFASLIFFSVLLIKGQSH